MARKDVTDSTVSGDMDDANDNFIELYLTKAEVEAARDGESSLLAQINAIQASIVAITGGALVLVLDTTPQLGGMLDVNGKSLGDGTLELLSFSETASAVNEITVKNAATGDGPEIQATGDDTNIDLVLEPKGTGKVKVGGSLDCNDNQIEGSSYTQIADVSVATGTHTFAYASGDMQQVTATGDITLATSGFVSGAVCAMIIDAVNFGAHTITHPAAWLFKEGAAPKYTVAGTDRLLLLKDKDDIYTLHVIDQDIKAVS